MATELRLLCHFVAALLVSAFGLNWLWELAQMPAYAEMAGRSWRQTVPTCTLAAVGDVGMTLAIYAVGALAAGSLRWRSFGDIAICPSK